MVQVRGTSVVCEEAAASETIFVSAMNICPAVAGKLVAAHERGVFVCAIYSKFQSDRTWVTSLQALLDAGMHDVVTSKVLLHQKVFYTTQRGLWIGSSNFTTQALRATWTSRSRAWGRPASCLCYTGTTTRIALSRANDGSAARQTARAEHRKQLSNMRSERRWVPLVLVSGLSLQQRRKLLRESTHVRIILRAKVVTVRGCACWASTCDC